MRLLPVIAQNSPTRDLSRRTLNPVRLSSHPRFDMETDMKLELAQAIFKSKDLVDAVFGHLVDLRKAEEYVEKLIAQGCVSVKQPKVSDEAVDARTAILSASEAAQECRLGQSRSEDSYVWSWTDICTDDGSVKFLNDIIQGCLSDDDTKNLFVAPFYTIHAFPLAYGRREDTRPDFILLPKDKMFDALYHNFSVILSPGELKTSDASNSLLQVSRYNRVTNLAQPGRRFVVSMAFTGPTVTLVRTDQSGMEYCTLDITSSGGAINFIRVLVGFAIASDQDLGLDPNVVFKPKKCHATISTLQSEDPDLSEDDWLSESEEPVDAPPKRVELVARTAGGIACRRSATDTAPVHYKILGLIYNASSICGRGVQTYVAQKEGNKGSRLLALKRSWQENKCLISEQRFHRLARDGGVTNVLLANEVYKSYVDGREDTTLYNIRNFAESAAETLGVENRTLVYLEFDLKRPMRYFCSLQDFVMAIADAMEGHKFLVEKKILHRDISENNVVLALNPSESSRGYLIDLDMATDYNYEEQPFAKGVNALMDESELAIPRRDEVVENYPAQKGDRTGTTPYMAISVLKGGNHGVREDLESFFYVIFLFFFSFRGPLPQGVLKEAHENGYIKRLGDKGAAYRTHILLWPELMQQWSHGSFSAIADSKRGFFEDKTEVGKAFQQRAMNGWDNEYASMVVLFPRIYNMFVNDSPVPSHDSFIGILRDWLKRFPVPPAGRNSCPFHNGKDQLV
ncbi:hypothetical protein DFH11DRAFT_1591222 [Phellopilus nigrolimitatus]|nr:hypothetical protein DFH11DRAFT_1591222 [Phellopilus nigrolimitatus]